MNQAAAQGLAFGKDIIFTFGPYASIYTRCYHPSTDMLMVCGTLYLALSYWACLVVLMRGVQWRWVLAVCAILAGLRYTKDPLLLSLPLLAGLLSFKLIHSEEARPVKSQSAAWHVALLFAPLGLLPLVKGSLLILCAAVAVLCCAFFLANKQRLPGIMCLLSPVASMLFFWIVSGQPLAALPSYFMGMAPIISGYTEAMAVDGNVYEIALYLAASAFVLLEIFIQNEPTPSAKIFLFCIYFVFLFISFKAGFVRHDSHAMNSAGSILLAGILLPFVIKTRLTLPIIFLIVVTWAYIDSHYLKTSIETVANNTRMTYSSMWRGVTHRLRDKNWPKVEFDAALNFIRQQAAFPVLQGTADIYSYNQAYLVASGNAWLPRPILQSYSAYTPVLAEKNRQHLLGDKAPDNVIFRVEPIDGRIPSSEDGASWPVLLLKYQPTRMENDFLFLQKATGGSEAVEPLQIKSEKHSFGESVAVPRQNQPVFAQVEIKPTLLGRVAGILFKPSQLQITLDLENGTKKSYRIIANMSKSGFIVSPLIENTSGFLMLYGKQGLWDGKRVKSMGIAPRDGKSLLWQDEYSVTFSQVKTSGQSNISNPSKLDGFADELSDAKTIAAARCDGSIDTVNGTSPAPTQFSASTLLEVKGWLAVSAENGVLPEAATNT